MKSFYHAIIVYGNGTKRFHSMFKNSTMSDFHFIIKLQETEFEYELFVCECMMYSTRRRDAKKYETHDDAKKRSSLFKKDVQYDIIAVKK